MIWINFGTRSRQGFNGTAPMLSSRGGISCNGVFVGDGES
jgi:hypothetical protein